MKFGDRGTKIGVREFLIGVICVLCGCIPASAADIAPVIGWTVKTEQANAIPLTLRRGETAILQATFTNGGAAVHLGEASSVLLRYTGANPATNTTYHVVTGAVHNAASGITRVRWTPAAEIAADMLAYEIAVTSPTSTLCRAFGTIRMLAGVGDSSATVNTQTFSTIDWATVQNQNTGSAPFLTGASAGDITAVTAGTGLSGGGTSGAVTLNLANTAVSAGSYSLGNFTVDAQGRLTAASSSTVGGGLLTYGGGVIGLATNAVRAALVGASLAGDLGVDGTLGVGTLAVDADATVGNNLNVIGVITGDGSGLSNIDLSDSTVGQLSIARLMQGGATAAQVLTWSGTEWAPATPAASGIAGTLGTVDNAIPRANGTGGSTAQGSDLVIEDAATATTNNVQLRNVHAGQTNSALVLTPLGTGSFIIGARPDGTGTGGNARGAHSVDLQASRSGASRVASGANSAILGGTENTASGQYASNLGGYFNTSSGLASLVFGYQSTASAQLAMAFGRSVTSSHGGAVVVNCDPNNNAVASDRVNQFKLRATGGFTLVATGGTSTNWGNQSSAPVTGIAAGDVYYDTTTNKHRGYNGTGWNDFY